MTLVILAAGMGSRYGGLKQLDSLGPQGQTIMDYSVHDAVEAGFTKVVFVIRKDFSDEFKTKVLSRYDDKVRCEVVYQEMDSMIPASLRDVANRREKPWGTGHAILVTKDFVNEPFAAINADDFYGRDAFDKMADWLRKETTNGQYSMVGYKLSNTLSDHGSVNRGICVTEESGKLKSIFEGLKIHKSEGDVIHLTQDEPESLDPDALVSMNFWGFQTDIFEFLEHDFQRFVRETEADPKSEYFIPFVVNDMMQKGIAEVTVLPTVASWQGVTYQEDRPLVVAALRKMTESGVYEKSF